jgi:nicotinate-nucleotide pyrophosphorylase (carboxylating)
MQEEIVKSSAYNVGTYSNKKLERILDLALDEDLGEWGDVTSNLTIAEDRIVEFKISNRERMVLCGVDIAMRVFDKVSDGQNISLKKYYNDGVLLDKGTVIISGKGNARIVFAAERVALNLMQHLSGIATKVRGFVGEVEGDTKILDTRKTIPGLRELQKYSVVVGGGCNHRMALYDGILIKDNHIAAAGSIACAVNMVKDGLKNGQRNVPQDSLKIEVECDDLRQVKEALDVGVDIIMLDNMNLEQINEAVMLIKGRSKIEVSGNIGLDRVKEISRVGVDYISVGSLTHSVKAVDIGLDVL